MDFKTEGGLDLGWEADNFMVVLKIIVINRFD